MAFIMNRKFLIISTLIVILLSGAFVVYSPVDAQDVKGINLGKEITSLRQENTKTYDAGNGQYTLEVHLGPVHYKDDYSNVFESWKDIDLNWQGNTITTAPYELTVTGNTITIRDKKTGKESQIELLSTNKVESTLSWQFSEGKAEATGAFDIPITIIAEDSAVRFRHTLSPTTTSFEAQYRVTGDVPFNCYAFDDLDMLKVTYTHEKDILTEKLTVSRPTEGNISIDPTWQVGQSSDDASVCNEGNNAPYWNLTYGNYRCGYLSSDYEDFSSAALFSNVTIPANALIQTAHLLLVCRETRDSNDVNTRLRCQANVNPSTFSDKADFDGRTWTTAYTYWDAIEAWVFDEEYDSADFADCVQEVIEMDGWSSGNPIAVLWDDFEQRSTQTINYNRTSYAYDTDSDKAPQLIITYIVPPTVSTSNASDIGTTYATLNGNITATGGENCDYRGFQWGLSSGNYSDNWTGSGSFGTGAFDHQITSLSDNTTYYYRAIAHNSAGWGYGSEVEFSTEEEVPENPSNAPSGLRIRSVSSREVLASWDTSYNVSGYLLLVSTEGYPDEPEGDYEIAYSGNSTSARLLSYDLDAETYYFSLWTEINSYSSTYETASIGGDTLADALSSLNGTIMMLIQFIPLALFMVIAFWRNSIVPFILAGTVSIGLGLYWFDASTSYISLIIAMALIANWLLCWGFALRLIFWKPE